MNLPVMPPVTPMLAKAVPEVPDGDFLYEPKWDGFRSIIFRDGDEVEIGSRNEKPMTRYFPDVVEAVKSSATRQVRRRRRDRRTARDGRLEFEALQQRIHPAESRVRKLAAETPAHFIGFDLLAVGDESLMDVRSASGEPARARPSPAPPTSMSRQPLGTTQSRESGSPQFEGAGLDGVIAKSLDLPYSPDKRVMFKIKHARTADCVLAGFRWHKSGPIVGSLVLGLYDGDQLRHVGVAASFPMKRRAELVEELAPLREGAGGDHPWTGNEFGPGGAPNRWNAGKDMSFEPLRPERVVEVAYDQMEGSRFRHTAQFRRWRDDRDPTSCTFAQLERPLTYALADVLSS